ncbi:MAG: hypothetical protein ABSF89_07615 [Acidimicrobiales bacterium]
MAICSATLKKFGAGRVEVATIGRHPDHLHVHLPPRWPGTRDEVPWHAVDEWDRARGVGRSRSLRSWRRSGTTSNARGRRRGRPAGRQVG